MFDLGIDYARGSIANGDYGGGRYAGKLCHVALIAAKKVTKGDESN